MGVRIIVCGGRDFSDRMMLSYVLSRVHAARNIIEVIHGCAKGADLLADHWARLQGISVTPVPAEWEVNGRAAGPIRNREMLKLNPNGVVAFPGGPGTADMMTAARERGVPVLEALALWKER